jgi:hypothetical protein
VISVGPGEDLCGRQGRKVFQVADAAFFLEKACQGTANRQIAQAVPKGVVDLRPRFRDPRNSWTRRPGGGTPVSETTKCSREKCGREISIYDDHCRYCGQRQPNFISLEETRRWHKIQAGAVISLFVAALCTLLPGQLAHRGRDNLLHCNLRQLCAGVLFLRRSQAVNAEEGRGSRSRRLHQGLTNACRMSGGQNCRRMLRSRPRRGRRVRRPERANSTCRRRIFRGTDRLRRESMTAVTHGFHGLEGVACNARRRNEP